MTIKQVGFDSFHSLISQPYQLSIENIIFFKFIST